MLSDGRGPRLLPDCGREGGDGGFPENHCSALGSCVLDVGCLPGGGRGPWPLPDVGREGGVVGFPKNHCQALGSGASVAAGLPSDGRGPRPLPDSGREGGVSGFPENHCSALGSPSPGDGCAVGGIGRDGGATCRSLSVVTWNCASLFGAAPRDEVGRKRYLAKMNKVAGLARNHDVVFLQEVHGSEEDLTSLGCYIPNHLLCGSFCQSRAAGGVLTIIHPRLRQRYGECHDFKVVHPGRATVVDLVDSRDEADLAGGRHEPLSLCCIHVVPAWSANEKYTFLGRIRSFVPHFGEAVVFLAGDFNFPVDGEGRVNLSTERVTGGSDSVASHFDVLFDDLTEIAQDRPTRRRSEGGSITVLSRIDRVYSNISPGGLLARNACAATIGKLTHDELSDHVPVVARVFEGGVLSGSRPFVPGWVLSLPCFPRLVDDLSLAEGIVGPGCEGVSPFVRLSGLKRVVVKAARIAAEEAGVGECDSPSACLHWVSKARSAVRAGDCERLRAIITKAPRLSAYFSCDQCSVVDLGSLQRFCYKCVCDEINEEVADLKTSDLTEDEKATKKNKLLARLSSWSPKGRRVSGVAVLDEGGGVSGDPFGDISKHWM